MFPLRPVRKFLILLATFGCTVAHADDWPQWRGPDRTGYVPAGVKVPLVLPSAPKTLWHKEAGFSLASPVVSGGRVVCLDNRNDREVVSASDAQTGNELWNVDLDAATQDNQSKSGPRTTALLDGDRIYAQSCRGTLKCLNAADGKVIWQTNYVKDFGSIFIGEKGKAEGASRHGHTASPLIDGEHLIAEVGGAGSGIVCFDKKSGTVVWKTQDDMPGYAAPILATIHGVRQVVAFTATAVIGVEVDGGKLLWRAPIKTSLGRHAMTPIVYQDFVVVSSHQVGLIGIKITKDATGFNAEKVWTSRESAINYASAVAVDHYLYGIGPGKNLMCVDILTGKQAWSRDGFFTSSGGKAYAGMIVMDKNILILGDDGQLVLINADPSQCHEISRTQVAGNNWCNPAYADGKLYLRDANEVRCVELMP